MPTVREILESLQKREKKPRIATNEDSVLNVERTDAEQQIEGTSTRNNLDVASSDDEENCEPVQFKRGETIRGALCLWYQGFRFINNRKDGSWFRCEQRNCPATAKLEDNDLMTGILGPKSHHHGCAPSRYDAETKRNQMKRLIKETNGVNCADPLNIQIPPGLLIKNDESVLIYDSRELLSVLKQNRRWSLDGTFRSAPKPWMQVFVIGCYVNNRMVVAAQALLPVMSDFEIGMLKAMRHVFPSCERSGCSFHMAQAVFRKARSMGIFNLLNEDDDEVPVQRKSVHKTFRSVLSLALIPPDYVRHAFSLIVNAAPLGVQGWLAYFGKTYIGTTQFEIDRGTEAFGPNSDVGRFFLRRAQSTTPFSVSQASTITSNGRIQFGLHSPQPSIPTIPLSEESSLQLIRRWEQDIVCPPRFPISFWNVYTRAQMAIERTNNGMEAAHGQFARELNHHPSLSDFIAVFIKDIDKQLDIGRAERLQKSRKRPQRYIIKEQSVVRIIDEADFESEEGLTNALYLIGLVMQGFVNFFLTIFIFTDVKSLHKALHYESDQIQCVRQSFFRFKVSLVNDTHHTLFFDDVPLLNKVLNNLAFSVSQASTITSNGRIQFGLHSPQPSIPTIPLSEESSLQLIRRWEQDIVCPPRFPISFWNVYTRAQMAIERTNNGMEAAHGQFARELNHHPSLSDFIAAFIKDIDKQLDIGRAERLQKSRKRPQRYIIKEQSVVRIIDEADFESEEGLTNALYLIGLVMQGFVEGLHVRENEDSEEETDDTDGN
ncbi:hypothetical protein niasHT_016229 [Heterodera trifolii]|uniref:Transposase n=1 Tax=Heterodera trifolii TaxID=157864 RepID=A0ABD2L6R1_9BILA